MFLIFYSTSILLRANEEKKIIIIIRGWPENNKKIITEQKVECCKATCSVYTILCEYEEKKMDNSALNLRVQLLGSFVNKIARKLY